MNYSSISIQGNIFTSEIFEKIRQEDTRFQTAKDFNLNQGDSVRDEINLAWSLAISHWNVFKQKRETLSQTDTGTTETRRYWILPLLQILGYNVSQANAEIINDKSYAVSHRANNKDDFPIHIVGIQQTLDKKADIGGARLSPHALIQEYLNNTEHLYGFTTNGAMLRLLRDATRLSRLSYIEFNLEQMMEEGLFAEFALLYRTLHGSRVANKKEENAESILEWYHQEALSSGSRIRERLSQAVEQSILLLANGILENPSNESLRQEIEDNKITPHQYYLHILRTVYRILFLLVIEERKLTYPEKRDIELNRKRDVYYKFYSVQRLTYLVDKKVYIDPRKTDLWQSLLTTFHLFENSEHGTKLGISALGSGLFAPNALGGLQDQLVCNEVLLKVLRYLVTFENVNHQLVRVNYADLDVEEFGSIYEGLLEYAPVITNHRFNFVKGDERSSSGSHYTPEELVKPLIVHSLDYLIADRLKEADPEAGLLSLSICDVACGSGHILLSAARRVGFELAKYRSREDQPTPSVLRIAIRDVIRNCIYGVDLNPLAVELCKVALWLEAHEPGQPMNFLDHRIKCGNAIVGLAHFEELENGIASEAFKTQPGDQKEIASAFKKRNESERKIKNQLATYDVVQVDNSIRGIQKEFQEFIHLPENTPIEIARKETAYTALTSGKKWWRLKQLADIQIAQFFIPKTEANKAKLTTQSQYQNYLKQGSQIMDRGAALAIAEENRFFHWFLEFPSVFQGGGFDCILGNPPYKGGSKLSTIYGSYFTNFIASYYIGVKGMADLVSYFIRRNIGIIKTGSFFSIITTNKVAEGNTRKSSLDYLIENGNNIVFAIKSREWPGAANVHVSLFSVIKDIWLDHRYLDNKKTDFISSFLSDEPDSIGPSTLLENVGISYTGSKVYGEGFIIDESTRAQFINEDPENINVIKLFISGEDLNSYHPNNWKRFAIDLNKYSENQATKFKVLYEHLKKTVYPIRQLLKTDKSAKNNWWKYQRERKELYEKIKHLDFVFVMAQTSKYIMLKKVNTDVVFSVKCIIFSKFDLELFLNIQSSFHNLWAWKFGTTMGATTLQYATTACFETFPFAKNIETSSAKKFIDEVDELQDRYKCGLTHIFNGIHSRKNELITLQELDRLRLYYKLMDYALLEAYGWLDIDLYHGFYEIEYLPLNDRVRYTIHPEAGKEVLKRLLELNHRIHSEEIAVSSREKKPITKSKKAIEKTIKKEQYEMNQVSLFDINKSLGMREFSLNEGIYSIIDAANIIKQPVHKVRRWFRKLSDVDYEGLGGTAKTDIENRRISFHGLIELVVIGTLLENKFSIKNIIKARTDLKAKSGKELYPFATNNVKDDLKVAGNYILFQFPHGTVTLDGTGQYNLDIIEQFFKDIVFEDDIAMRIIPQAGNGEIIIDPKFAGGKPSFVKHHDLEVEMILGFYDDEDSIPELMENYGLSKKEIEAALSYSS